MEGENSVKVQFERNVAAYAAGNGRIRIPARFQRKLHAKKLRWRRILWRATGYPEYMGGGTIWRGIKALMAVGVWITLWAIVMLTLARMAVGVFCWVWGL